MCYTCIIKREENTNMEDNHYYEEYEIDEMTTWQNSHADEEGEPFI